MPDTSGTHGILLAATPARLCALQLAALSLRHRGCRRCIPLPLTPPTPPHPQLQRVLPEQRLLEDADEQEKVLAYLPEELRARVR